LSRFVVYIAMSLDGYIADVNGDVHWLEAFERDDYGYEEFLGAIGSILMGRVTYEQIMGFGRWPYGKTPCLVWTRRPFEDLPEGVGSCTGNLEEVSSRLEEGPEGRDIWVLGGAQTIQSFLYAGMIERMDIFVVPLLLGGGIRLFETEDREPELLALRHAQPYANGVVKLSYTMRE